MRPHDTGHTGAHVQKPGAKYDFFISYTEKDQAWAWWIAEQLEQAGYVTVFQARNFDLKNFMEQMQDALVSSCWTIAILSPRYLTSAMTELEWTAALRVKRLVTVRVRRCKPEGMLGTIPYIDLVRLGRKKAGQKLLDSITHRPMALTPPPPPPRRWSPFPGPVIMPFLRELGPTLSLAFARLRRVIRRHWAFSTIIFLLLAVAGYYYGPAQMRWTIARAFRAFSGPGDYLSAFPGPWRDNFRDRVKTGQKWNVNNLASWREDQLLGKMLAIDNGGFAITKEDFQSHSFYDFDAMFKVTLPPGGTSSWAFRVWPQNAPGDIRRSRGYLFILSLEGPAHIVTLKGSRCAVLGDADACEPLRRTNETKEHPDFCFSKSNPTFQVTASSKGPALDFWVDIDPPTPKDATTNPQEEGACVPQFGGKFSFLDDRRSLVPFSAFGAIAFLDSQMVRSFTVAPRKTIPIPGEQ